MFEQLDKVAMNRIIDIELASFYKRVEELGYKLNIDDDVKSFLIEKGYDRNFGARPLKRAIQTHIEDTLADFLLVSDNVTGNTIRLSLTDDKEKVIASACDDALVENPTK